MAEEINANLDTTPLPPNDLVAQDPQSAELAGYVRTKTFGRDVRESIARSIELNSTRSKNAEELANETVNVANDLTDRFNQQIGALTEDSEVIDARGGKDTLGQRLNETDAQLVQTNKKFTNKINITDFPRLGSETDDTQRFQRAIDSFKGNIAGTIVIPYDIRISAQVTCNKTGLRLEGVSNRKSRIICTHGGIGLFIKPLYNGNPYTSISYCKFYADNIAIVAEGEATVTGTGLWLQWVYASSFTNLYTSGFAKHIVLKGSHLNTFYNLYQGNKDTSEQTLEIHNRGVGLSADGSTDETGETTSNNNHIIGGWLNNCSWDFTNMPGMIVEKVDIEPASNSIITGNGAIFRDNRFERFTIYSPAKYPLFTWFIVGSRCKFKDNEYYNAGASYNSQYPVFQINGDYNEIEVPNRIPYNHGFLSFSETAKGNFIDWNAQYTDFQTTLENLSYKDESVTLMLNSQQNRVKMTDKLQGTITDVIGSHTRASGEFICRSSKNVNIVASGDYEYQGCTSKVLDIPLPIGRVTGTASFSKITLNVSDGNRRMLLGGVNAQTAPKDGVYTLTATMLVPSTSSVDAKVGVTLDAQTKVFAKDKWVTIRSRSYLRAGEKIQPTFKMEGITGDVFYVGEISVCDGNTSVYIANDTYTSKSESF